MVSLTIDFFIFLNIFLILTSALSVVLSRGAVQSVLFLILTFFNSAILLFYLGIEYLAYVFIIVYVGAIAVLFLFVVMMLNLAVLETPHKSNRLLSIISFCGVIAILGVLVISTLNRISLVIWVEDQLVSTPWSELFFLKEDIKAVGETLFNRFWLEFLFCSIILLSSMLGTIGLTLSSRAMLINQFNKKQDLFKQVSRKSNIFIKSGRVQLD